jgi:site-specific DNA recombinase
VSFFSYEGAVINLYQSAYRYRPGSKANQEERRKLLLTILDGVYVGAKKSKSIVTVKPKPLFKPVFQVAASQKGSDIRILNEPLQGSSMFLGRDGEDTVSP